MQLYREKNPFTFTNEGKGQREERALPWGLVAYSQLFSSRVRRGGGALTAVSQGLFTCHAVNGPVREEMSKWWGRGNDDILRESLLTSAGKSFDSIFTSGDC